MKSDEHIEWLNMLGLLVGALAYVALLCGAVWGIARLPVGELWKITLGLLLMITFIVLTALILMMLIDRGSDDDTLRAKNNTDR